MQEEVTRKTIALAIKTAKLDGKVLQAALWKLLRLYRKTRDTPHRGKQTLKQLMRHGTGVSNIEITDANIKAFESTAKKYGIDFALKKADDDSQYLAQSNSSYEMFSRFLQSGSSCLSHNPTYFFDLICNMSF